MTKSISWGIVGAVVAALVLGTVLGYFLRPSGNVQGTEGFGYIDSQRALNESELGKQYMARIQAAGDALVKEFSQLSNEQKVQRQAEFSARQSQFEQELSRKFQSRLNEIAAQLGKEKKLSAIFWQTSMAYGSIDLTDEVISALTAEPEE
ncbi:MAG: OmpH family outer membrane protein [Bacillota bacterium]|jgi:Skp family chaperone for outer membrane proteins